MPNGSARGSRIRHPARREQDACTGTELQARLGGKPHRLRRRKGDVLTVGEFDSISLGQFRRWIIPVFASYEASKPCHASCEFASYPTECKCKTCGGLNHGRSQFHVSNRPNNEKQFFVLNKETNQWRTISRWSNE